MKKLLVLAVIGLSLIQLGAECAASDTKLVVYTSMKESLIGKIQEAFVAKHPEVDFDYYSAGAGKIMAKIAAERQSGSVVVDILWTSEIPDFYQLKDQGFLMPYVSPEAADSISPVKDPDGCFTPARLGTIGIAYNTKAVKTAPTAWKDVLGPAFAGGFGIANPALSGTAFVSVALLEKTFGWEFFTKLRASGAKMGQGSGQVVDDTAAGDLKGCLGVDYITLDKIEKGATLALAFPPEMLVIPSPVAIIKGTRNLAAAKLFVDFLLSKEGQAIIAASGTLPIRADVPLPEGSPLPPPAEAVKRAMKVDYLDLIQQKEAIIKKFTEIMQAR